MSDVIRTSDYYCVCGHARSEHHLIQGNAICNVSPCACMDFARNERLCGACGRLILVNVSQHCGLDHAPLMDCPRCRGSGFEGNGSGYDAVCSECGGTKQVPENNYVK